MRYVKKQESMTHTQEEKQKSQNMVSQRLTFEYLDQLCTYQPKAVNNLNVC